MAVWLTDELHKIAKADDLHVSPLRQDGKTYGTPTWIWSVVVGDALYVRAYNGVKSRCWYQAALKRALARRQSRSRHTRPRRRETTKNQGELNNVR